MCVPQPSVTGYNGVFSTNGTGSTIVARNDVYSFAPSLTKIWGSHTLKFGAEIRRSTHNYYQQNSPSGTFNFDALMTAVNPFAAAGTAMALRRFCSDMATAAASIRTHWWPRRSSMAAYYAGDQWRVTPRLR